MSASSCFAAAQIASQPTVTVQPQDWRAALHLDHERMKKLGMAKPPATGFSGAPTRNDVWINLTTEQIYRLAAWGWGGRERK